MPVQVRLLRALQEREIQRVGGGRVFQVDVRELQNFIERSLILCPGPELILGERPGARQQTASAPAPTPSAVPRFEDGMRDLLGAALGATRERLYGPSGAASLLGIKPTTLQGKLRKYRVKAARGAHRRWNDLPGPLLSSFLCCPHGEVG